jgi:hypothetical protein
MVIVFISMSLTLNSCIHINFIISYIIKLIKDVLANRSGWKEVNENEGKAYIAFK